MRALIVTAAMLGLAACGGNPPVPESAPVPGTVCSDPRPQVCTMEYRPVCVTLIAGGTKQYVSGCNACADDAVASYLPEPCPSDP